ncbi:MAG TPA: thiamine-phosphate kinase [Pyrinomonadaceae bacterium]|jgi:thiamine-monophosphate kinase|nr:thiamine-phosphate kinase [Pyrinomonadaceae bacterium]
MNEFDFIDHLRRLSESRKHSTRVLTGIGDDAAIISESAGKELVFTTDLLVEDVDFYSDATSARHLGHKALAVSLSDVAAMGARPLWSFLSIGLTPDRWNSDFRDRFFAGYFELADRFAVTLSGGDVSESKVIVIDSIVLGEADAGAAVKRSGARAGDQIYVTGNLGGAAAGLKLIEMGMRVSAPHGVADGFASQSDDDAIQSLLLRQLRPQPRVGWGIVLGEQRLATSMIDISDGLSSDLNHLCRESNVGAVIEAASIPLDADVKRLCGRRALDPLALALHGGEDFELIFTVAPEDISRLPKKVDGVSITRIGEIDNLAGSTRIRERDRLWDLHPRGFSHFDD